MGQNAHWRARESVSLKFLVFEIGTSMAIEVTYLKVLLARMRPVVSGQLVRSAKLFAAILPVAGKRLFPGMRAVMSTEVRRFAWRRCRKR